MKNIRKFTIDRAKWRTGRYGAWNHQVGDSKLRNSKGFKCCLGFYLLACNVKGVTDIATPKAIREKVPSWLRNECADNSDACGELMDVNDCCKYIDIKREELVKRRFARQGIEVLFKGKYPKLQGDA